MDFTHYAHSILYTLMLFVSLLFSICPKCHISQIRIMAMLLHLRNERIIIRLADTYDKTVDAKKGVGRVHNLTSPKNLVINLFKCKGIIILEYKSH